ncbi:bifunctional aspartate kinase/homoserine dehydrogenase I [Flavobacteriaceae bacterium LSUCC0859]|nr:bifunctional aspartate kinase/homoserine dehydrogenase I [Flavobacteriaceae bacterium LSUCC0859]
MNVLKFGGSSVSGAKNIKLVHNIIAENAYKKQYIIVSALGGVTDLLLNTAAAAAAQDPKYKDSLQELENRHVLAIKELMPASEQSSVLSVVKGELNTLETLLEGAFLIGEITTKLSDKIVSYGELLSSYIISCYLQSKGLDCKHVDARKLITTKDIQGKTQLNYLLTNQKIQDFEEDNQASIIVMGGFIATSESGISTTLGRGGSDFTAAIVAAALNAKLLEIYTDVSGMYTANPKMVKQARPISEISYEEAMELSHFGAKVLYPPTIEPVLKSHIPILIKNTFEPAAAGTRITENKVLGNQTVQGISHVENVALISLEGPGMVGIPGVSKRFFEVLSQAQISVVFITQASSEHSICVGIDAGDSEEAVRLVNEAFEFEIHQGKIKAVIAEKDLAIIALVGDQMKKHQGLSGKMFATLGKNNVNIRAIAQGSSERNISAVIEKVDVKKALNALHEVFFEENTKQLNLFIMGVGNVGGKLLEQLAKQKTYLKTHLKLQVRVVGISNSKTMYFEEGGIDLKIWQAKLAQGDTADKTQFLEIVKKLNLRNAIFVDNTASEEIASSYAAYLSESISVVTCNKIACASAYPNYKKLKDLARTYNASFLFETNVGAGLPIIDTLKNLVTSGDKIHEIKAVLSGSLNFVFNHFNAQTTFHDIVKQAQEEGYTEPDPSIDLSGIDVMRKILILARESGHTIEITDIENQSFLPKESLETKTNEDFFKSLIKHESSFQALFKSANEKNCKLKYVASFKNGTASVGLQEIPEGHDFYALEGSDNIVQFYTERYPTQPMIIKGAGAGAAVTASGIFADIIRVGNN